MLGSTIPATVQPKNRTYEFPTFSRLKNAHVTLEPLDINHAIGLWHAVQGEPASRFEHLFFGPIGSRETVDRWITANHGTEVIPATVQLLLSHLFEFLGYRRVVWKCDTTNHASRTAAERMGFRHEGTFRKHMYIRGRSRDTAWYAIVDSDCPEAKVQLEGRLTEKARATRRAET